MIRRPPRSTQSRSSAASDVYKRQAQYGLRGSASWRKVGGTVKQSVLFVERRVHVEPDGHRALAAAVIRLALDDLCSTGDVSTIDRQTALDLLSDTRGVLTAWC